MKLFPLVILVSLLSSCFSEHGEHAHHHADDKKNEATEQKRMSLAKDSQDSLDKIYQANFRIHQAFIAEEMQEVKAAATELKNLIEQQNAKDELNELLLITEPLQLMSSLEDSDELAQAFGEVNKVMVAYLLKYELGSAFNVYYCPMVEKHWIQNSAVVDDVQNPYALYMLKCGTRETSFNI